MEPHRGAEGRAAPNCPIVDKVDTNIQVSLLNPIVVFMNVRGVVFKNM